jgi:hypothetical protein
MIYFARPVGGTVRLAEAEHHDIRWCTDAELELLIPRPTDAILWYCRTALREVR